MKRRPLTTCQSALTLPTGATASRIAALLLAGSISACSTSDTPLVDMCQRIAGNLSGQPIESWADPVKVNDDYGMNLTVSFTTTSGNSGNAICSFTPRGDDYVATPNKVLFNGEKVGFKELLAASSKASGNTIKDSAEETKKQSVKLAGEAREKAQEVAGQARVLAADAKERAAVIADQAGDKAEELTAKAREIAGEAGDKAREAALEATKSLQDKLEK